MFVVPYLLYTHSPCQNMHMYERCRNIAFGRLFWEKIANYFNHSNLNYYSVVLCAVVGLF